MVMHVYPFWLLLIYIHTVYAHTHCCMKSGVNKLYNVSTGFWMYMNLLLLDLKNSPQGFWVPFQNSSPVTVLNESSVLNGSIKIYNTHFLIPCSLFCHMITDISTIQVSNCPLSDPPLPLCRAHKPPCLSTPSHPQVPPPTQHHHGYNTSLSHSNTTEWPNSITCPIYLCWGRLAPWLQCKSLVPVNNLFSHSSKGLPLSLDIRLAEERWMKGVGVGK